MNIRIGQGYDVHAFGDGDHVMLGGVRVPHERGVLAHSDGDVVLHALCDALLGALALGDIGRHFPPSDPRWKGADSLAFLRHCDGLARARGWSVGNADVTVACERPKVGPHVKAIRATPAAALGVAVDSDHVQAPPTAAHGDIGRHFPPSDPRWKGADSLAFLRHCDGLARARGWSVGNADVTVVCERPKVGPHVEAMRATLAAALGIAVDAVSVKATTTEALGFTGRGEGIAAQAACLL